MNAYARKGLPVTALATGAAVALSCAAAQAAETASPGDIRSLAAKAFEVPDSTGITMVRVEAGSFTMGSPPDELGRGDDEARHRVTIGRPFYMAETEVTQEQYIPVMIPDYEPMFVRAAPYGHSMPEVHCGGPFVTESKYLGDTSKHPMEGVVWAKAAEFCGKLTGKERAAGRLPRGYVYRLPTEAEWEYACRAGTEGPFNTEGMLKYFSVGPNVGRLRWSDEVKGERRPNAWGLYDMHGNVYEWCLDWYGPYAGTDERDPTGPAGGGQKVARGGSYQSGKQDGAEPDPAKEIRFMRSAARNRFLPDLPLGIVGFRVVLGPEVKAD